jgi:hypothetical protein
MFTKHFYPLKQHYTTLFLIIEAIPQITAMITTVSAVIVGKIYPKQGGKEII